MHVGALEDAAPRELRATEEPMRLPRQELRERERSRERDRRLLEPRRRELHGPGGPRNLGPSEQSSFQLAKSDAGRQADATMRTYRRDPSTIQDYAMLGQGMVRRLGEEDHAGEDAQTHL